VNGNNYSCTISFDLDLITGQMYNIFWLGFDYRTDVHVLCLMLQMDKVVLSSCTS